MSTSRSLLSKAGDKQTQNRTPVLLSSPLPLVCRATSSNSDESGSDQVNSGKPLRLPKLGHRLDAFADPMPAPAYQHTEQYHRAAPGVYIPCTERKAEPEAVNPGWIEGGFISSSSPVPYAVLGLDISKTRIHECYSVAPKLPA